MRIARANIPVRIPKGVIRIQVRNTTMSPIPEITETQAASVKPYIKFYLLLFDYKGAYAPSWLRQFTPTHL